MPLKWEASKTYSSARELPNVDLAVIAVPAAAVSGVVDDCAAAGIRSIVVISAGFAETGGDGRALQHALTDKVRGYGMRMVGPNCMGVLNTDPAVRLNASFSPVFPPNGHIGFLSQSGALGIAIIELASQRGLGLSTFVSVGNKADVSGNDLLEYWEGDAATRVILLYLESFGNPRRFARLARRIGRKKPIIVVKSGRTRAGSRAAEQPHRRARGERCRGRCAVSSIRRDSRGHAGRDVRRRRVPRYTAPPAGTSCRDRHQRRRTGHPCRRRV